MYVIIQIIGTYLVLVYDLKIDSTFQEFTARYIHVIFLAARATTQPFSTPNATATFRWVAEALQSRFS
jgi:hypothetical protein